MSIYNNPIVKAWQENCEKRIEFLSYLKEMYGALGVVQIIVKIKDTICPGDKK